MNRLIKFRVWDNKKKIWLDKTDFCIYNGDAQEVEIGGTEYLYNGSSYNPLKFVENDIGGLYCNRNLIIQQYTGLNDSKGNPIYEGDIIEQNFGEKPTRGLVKFSRGSFRVIWPAEPYDDLGCMLIEYVTVIGNVFENPKMRGIYE